MRRGDVFYADLRPVIGSEQGGIRPVLIIQNDIGNKHSPTVICAAITSRMNKAKLPTHVELESSKCRMAKDSVILLEQVRTIDKQRLKEKAGATERRNRKGCEEQLEQYRIGRRAGLEALSCIVLRVRKDRLRTGTSKEGTMGRPGSEMKPHRTLKTSY